MRDGCPKCNGKEVTVGGISVAGTGLFFQPLQLNEVINRSDVKSKTFGKRAER
jgi:hypothetical protein